MSKPKFIESHEELNYKQTLKEFQAVINPDKFNSEEIERIKQHILTKRDHIKK